MEMDPGDAWRLKGTSCIVRTPIVPAPTAGGLLICSYNAVENAPFKKVREYGNYEPLRKVPAGSFRMAS